MVFSSWELHRYHSDSVSTARVSYTQLQTSTQVGYRTYSVYITLKIHCCLAGVCVTVSSKILV